MHLFLGGCVAFYSSRNAAWAFVNNALSFIDMFRFISLANDANKKFEWKENEKQNRRHWVIEREGGVLIGRV